jgi:hypothetical protein
MPDDKSSIKKDTTCSVCRGSRLCTYCSGDGYIVEVERLNPCGVCETTGICQICKPGA